MLIAGSWIAAARWSGRLDFRPLLAALDEGPDALARSEAPPSFVLEARRTRALDGPAPLRLGSSEYPARLLDLERPPPLIWFRGECGRLGDPALSIVGARASTPYGRAMAASIAREVCRREGVVVSGGARGIDTAAHESCLSEGGGTVAVLGGGLEGPFTGTQRRLHARIREGGGLLLSEQPPWDPARRWTFPRRNRLIAALGWATVVVEAGKASGSRHTACAAREMGREVLAVPGRVGEPASVGCLQLIAEGASCVTSVVAVADRLGRPLSGRLLSALPASPLELSRVLGQEARGVMGLLAMLELRGIVQRMPDGRYGLR